jgi:FkbM family methyltransferase
MKKFRPMKRIRPYLRRLEAQLRTRRDRDTGFLFQDTLGHRVYLKSTQDFIKPQLLEWLTREIYFKHYVPAATDTVVDIGVGLGHEAVWLGEHTGVRNYFGVEIQPSIYECLCNTMHEAGFGHKAVGTAISRSTDDVFLRSAETYQTKSTLDNDGYIRVPTITWPAFLDKFSIGQIDLLKVNIEGGETHLLPSIGDFANIRRVIISAHDFRADAGEGEHFRTLAFVRAHLQQAGYSIRPIGSDWLRNWLYAERA